MDSSDAGQQAEIAPPIEFGIASTCSGTVALLLFFLPILSIPIAICGLLAGLGGLFRHRRGAAAGFRWSLIGCLLSLTVAIIGCILANAPLDESPSRAVPAEEWKAPGRPYVSPPARPWAD